MRRDMLSLLVLSFVVLFATNLFADEIVVFGPKSFKRTKGKPNTYSGTFTIQNPGGEATLTVVNGNANGKMRVSSAIIKLNGNQILGTDDFNQQVGKLERSISLENENKLLVELRSKPGSYLTIEVSQTGEPVSGILLPGNADELAADAVYDYISEDRVAEGEVTYFSSGGNVVRTKLQIGFVGTATVGEINSLLSSAGARITAMLADVNQLIIRIPDPGSIDQLDELVASLKANPLVRYVLTTGMPEPDDLPDGFALTGPPPLSLIDHHLAVRAHAAWNAKNALDYVTSQSPLLVMFDGFGDKPPGSDFNVVLEDPTDFKKFSLEGPQEHGYHVLGIIAATWGGPDNDAGWVTGMYPGQLPLRVIDRQAGFDQGTANDMIVNIVNASDRNVIVNTSMRNPCDIPHDRACVEDRAESWIEMVRQKGVESKFLHLTSAGNIKGAGDNHAEFNSTWSAARLLTDIENEYGDIPPLDNTLVVENRWNSADNPQKPYFPHCLDASSKYYGDISAIGQEVYSLLDPGPGGAAGDFDGTSMATPQVSGLAAYVWALKPDLKSDEVLAILEHTSKEIELCPSKPGPPVIDAYTALLAVDDPRALTGAATPDKAPARLAVLDVANSSGNEGFNLRFDEHDIQRFLDAFYPEETEPVDPADPPEPQKPDYSRYDLNGDGFTGGDSTTILDLNANYDPGSGLKIEKDITMEIEGTDVHFNEEKVSDMAALCYYAYSELYDGNTQEREGKLSHLCLPIKLVLGGRSEDGVHQTFGFGGSGSYCPIMENSNFPYCTIGERWGEGVPPIVEGVWDGPTLTWANNFLVGGFDLDDSKTFTAGAEHLDMAADCSVTFERSMGDNIRFRSSANASGAPPIQCETTLGPCIIQGEVVGGHFLSLDNSILYINNFTGEVQEIELTWDYSGSHTHTGFLNVPYNESSYSWFFNLTLFEYINLKDRSFTYQTVVDIERSEDNQKGLIERGMLSGSYSFSIDSGHYQYGLSLRTYSQGFFVGYFWPYEALTFGGSASCNGTITMEWVK